MKKLTFLIVLPLIASCSGGWSQEYRKQFLDVCKEEANTWAISDEQANSYCDCKLSKVMARYDTIEETIVNKDSVELNKEMLQCDVVVGK